MSLKKSLLLLLSLCLCLPALQARAQDAVQNSVRPSPTKGMTPLHGRLVLLMPFQNNSGNPSLDWIGDAFPDIFGRRLAGADFLPLGRRDRLYAFDHLGLPANFVPSRAMTIKIAQLLDADYVIVGSYTVKDNRLTAQAQILDMAALTLSQPIESQSPLSSLLDNINNLAWEVVHKIDPGFQVAEQTFRAADGKVPPGAYENYIRGIIAPTLPERIDHLKISIRLDPNFFPAWTELGLAYFANEDYTLCAATLGHLPRNYTRAAEADFYRGLAFFYTGNYLEAENAFAFVAQQLPMPEVLNNEGVAASRRGKPAADFFKQAIAADPKNPTYYFNLAVTLDRQHDTKGAIAQLQQELKLAPKDTEAKSFLSQLQNPPPPNPDPGKAVADFDTPLERIERSYNGASVRQAAFELEQVEEMRIASLPPTQRAHALVQQGNQFLDRGLILEAEREYHSALNADPRSAPALAGLAVVRERSGNLQSARKQAQASIAIRPSATAYLVLAQIDYASKNTTQASNEVKKALQLDPHNPAALSLRQKIDSSGAKSP
ncbi:MAG: tetratricopeptide repeat protein [Acidobacteriaceae bacterium]